MIRLFILGICFSFSARSQTDTVYALLGQFSQVHLFSAIDSINTAKFSSRLLLPDDPAKSAFRPIKLTYVIYDKSNADDFVYANVNDNKKINAIIKPLKEDVTEDMLAVSIGKATTATTILANKFFFWKKPGLCVLLNTSPFINCIIIFDGLKDSFSDLPKLDQPLVGPSFYINLNPNLQPQVPN